MPTTPVFVPPTGLPRDHRKPRRPQTTRKPPSRPLPQPRVTAAQAVSAAPRTALRTRTKVPITTVSNRQLSDLVSNGRVVVLKVYANYCRGCRGVEPKFRKIAAAYADSPNRVSFCQLDFEHNEEFCRDTLGAQSLPFFAIWKDGKYVSGEAMGWQSVGKKLVDNIESVLGADQLVAAGHDRRL